MNEPAQSRPARDRDTPSGGPAPALAIVRGSPSAEEVAALAVVLARLGARSADATYGRRVRSEWSARFRLLRAPVQRGPGGWRASARPR
jgi:hypothetical protein